MTKPITATALMILQDEGKLSVDDPVAKYIPQFKDVSLVDGPAKTEMTIRHLMTHTSGIGGEQHCIGSLKATAEELATRKLSFEPGTEMAVQPRPERLRSDHRSGQRPSVRGFSCRTDLRTAEDG